jgi:hypothetical protein
MLVRFRGALYQSNQLYHVSSMPALASISVGDSFTLKPGPQGAEGQGVYFSEGAPRFTAAEGTQRTGVSAVVVIPQPLNVKDWYRTKGIVVRKYGRPRTWHSKGRNVRCVVEDIRVKDGLPFLFCSANLVA